MSDAETAMSPPDQVDESPAGDVEASEVTEEIPAVDGAVSEEPEADSEVPSPHDVDDTEVSGDPSGPGEPERSEADRLADDLEGDLVGVDDALKRLDDGSYGTCTTCGAALDDALLEADPTSSVCRPTCAASATTSAASG